MLPGGCQMGVPARGVLWAHKQARQTIHRVYSTLQSSPSLTGTKSALNKVQPSLGQLTDSLCQALPGLRRSPPCETLRRVGRCSGWRKVSPSQLWVWDAAYSNSCSSTSLANGSKNRRRSQQNNAAHGGSNFLLMPLTHHFISHCLGSGYLYLSQKTVVVIKGNLLLFLLKSFVMRF